MKIGYIIGRYPNHSKTFIDREIVELMRQGVDCVIISIRPGEKFTMSREVEHLAARTRHLLPVNWRRFVTAHLRFGLTQFSLYIRTLLYLLTRPCLSLPARGKTLLHFLEGVYAAELLRCENVDLIHAHFIDRAATVALIVSRLLNVPYSITAHARDIYVNPILLPEKIAGARFVVTCTACNKAHLDQIAGPHAADKIYLIYHGIELAGFEQNGKPPANVPRLLAVGRLQAKKGFAHLIGACHLLKLRGRYLACDIIGEGPEQPALSQLIAQLGVGDIATLKGQLSFAEVMEHYRRADVFVLPSVVAEDGDRDGIPNVLLEAMAMQLPAVSTTVSGIPELVEDGANGCLVPAGDDAALADALAQLLDNATLRESLGKAGRVKVARDFDIHRNVSQLLALYSQQLARSQAPQDAIG